MNLWGQISEAWARVFAPLSDVSTGSAGRNTVIRQSYDPMSAMSTLARFPWVWVCARARASDLSGLPLLAVRSSGALETVITTHPTLSLLRRPSPGCSGLRYRRQVHLDWVLTGNSMSEKAGPSLLYRMHPGLSKPVVNDSTGRIDSWIYNGKRSLPNEQILHVADVSWEQTLSMVLGESAIRALNDDLNTILSAKQMAATMASRGRPEIIMSPGSEHVNIGADAIKDLEARWEQHTKSKHGLFVVGRDFKHEMVAFTPRDIEFQSQREFTRDTILAVFEVPPARAGLATANYGTQKQQMRTYWESILKGQGALFEDEWSTLTGDLNLRIEHDTTNIEALQLSRTERQLRAERWMNSFGMSPQKAAEAESFNNLPKGSLPAIAPGNQSRPPAREPDEPQRDLTQRLTGYLQAAAGRYESRILSADGEISAIDDLKDEEGIRVLQILESEGVRADVALEMSQQIAGVSDEAVRIVASDAWSRGVTRIGYAGSAAFGTQRAADVVATIARSTA